MLAAVLSTLLVSALPVLGLSAFAAGCARDGRWELLTVQAPEGTTRLDAGRAIELTGSGFPVGREVEVSLRGVLHAPLATRRRVAHTIVGRTVSSERLALTVSDADVSAIGGRGTFVGTLEVVVHGASLDGLEARIVGVIDDVRLEVVPSERRARELARQGRGGVPLDGLLGLTLVREDTRAGEALDDDETATAPDEDLAPEGARIEALDARGAAARLGLVPLGVATGARVLSIDGMNVLAPEELRVEERASRTVLSLEDPTGRVRTVVVDLDAARGRRADQTTRHDQLAVVVLVAALLFGAWPWSRRAARPEAAPERQNKPHAAVLTAALALTLTLACSTLSSSMLSSSTAIEDWVGSEASVPFWLGVALFCRVSAALAAARPLSPARPPLRAGRLDALRAQLALAFRREGLLAFVGAAAATVAVGAFITARGSAECASLPALGGPLASASWMPMSWGLVRAPFGPFALAAVLLAASATGEAIALPRTRTERLLRGLDDLGLAALASVFVRLTIADPSSTEIATRATALIATVALYLALLRARSVGARARWLPAVGATLASVLTALVALAWLEFAPGGADAATEQAVAEVVLVCVGMVIVRVASLGEPSRAGASEDETPPPGPRRPAKARTNSTTFAA